MPGLERGAPRDPHDQLGQRRRHRGAPAPRRRGRSTRSSAPWPPPRDRSRGSSEPDLLGADHDPGPPARRGAVPVGHGQPPQRAWRPCRRGPRRRARSTPPGTAPARRRPVGRRAPTGVSSCAITPWRSTATWSAMDSASSWSWVTRMEVVPAWRRTAWHVGADGWRAWPRRATRTARRGGRSRDRWPARGPGRPVAAARPRAGAGSDGGSRTARPARGARPPALRRSGPRGRPKATLRPTLRCGKSAPSCGT